MYEEHLKYYQGFPVNGVNFVDIIPLMQDKTTFCRLIRDLGALCDAPNVAAPEARGFLFAAPMLTECANVENLIPVRKKGKLPYREGDLVGVDIMKEYGADQLFFRPSDIAAGKAEDGVFRVTLFDDILATGGTAEGVALAMNRTEVELDGKKYRVKVADFVFLGEVPGLGGRERLEAIAPVKTLIPIA